MMKMFLYLRAESTTISAYRSVRFGRWYATSASNDLQRHWKKPKGRHEGGRNINDNTSPSNSKYASKQSRQNNKHLHYTKPELQPFQPPFSAFISCLPGLEPLLLKEVEYLHSHWSSNNDHKARSRSIPQILAGGVALTVPSLHHLHILHLYLGTASHIYLRLNDDNLFTARGFPELQRKVKDLIISQRWDQWLTNNGHSGNESSPVNVQIHVTTSKSKLVHTKAVEERLKQTIGEVIPRIHSSESDAQATIRLMARINRDVVQLSLDTSLTPLHRRGYRLKPYKAPLREDLAYALLMSGGLMPIYDLRSQFPNNADDSSLPPSSRGRKFALFDPFCGSGTIAIEGASLQLGLPPGRFRPPPLEGTSFCNPALWEEMISKALSVSGAEQNEFIPVAAGDIDPKALDAAISNAKRAGVVDSINFVKGSFVFHPYLKQQSSPEGNSNLVDRTQSLLVVANPPYGKRLSANEKRSTIYRKLANALLSLSSPRSIDCAMIGTDLRVMREAGLPLKVAFSTKHGGLNVVAMSGKLP